MTTPQRIAAAVAPKPDEASPASFHAAAVAAAAVVIVVVVVVVVTAITPSPHFLRNAASGGSIYPKASSLDC